MKTATIILLVCIVIAGSVIAGCTSYSTPAPATTQTTQAAVMSPGISITSPVTGATITGSTIHVTIMVNNFNIVNKQGQASASGEGHVHFYLDVTPLPSDPVKPAIPSDTNAAWAHVSGTSYTFTNVTPGLHTISAQLVNNDHTPVTPIVTQSVMVTTVSAPATSAPATTSAGMGYGSVPTVTITLTAKNFAFDKSTITVPAGANVIMTFYNLDNGIPHNFALYTDSTRRQKIYGGELITGTETTVYRFNAPLNPGTYFFQCDVHPNMNGAFIVT